MTTSREKSRRELDRGALSTIDTVAMAIAVLSPAAAMAYNTTGAALFGGTSTPLAFLLAGIACLALAFVVIGFARRIVSAGYLYTYASRVFGPSSGFLVGWLYFFGFFCFVPMTMAGVGGFSREFIRGAFSIHLSSWTWFPLFFIGMIGAVVLNITRVAVSARTQLTLGFITILIVVIVDLLITISGGESGHTLAPFTFTHTLKGGVSGVFFAVVFGVLSYVGFETGAVLGEETRNPRKAIPASVLATVIFSILFYVWTTYSISIGVGATDSGAETWAQDPRVLATLAAQYGGRTLALMIDLAAITSGFVVSLACIATASRTLFAMARDGALPEWFGETHPRYRTPANATIAIGAFATLIAGIARFISSDDSLPFTIYYFLGAVGSLSITIIYCIACVAGIVWLKKFDNAVTAPKWIPIPVAGLVVFALAIYGSIYPGELPPWPYRGVPYLVSVWIFSELLVLCYLKCVVPQRIIRIGSIMGENS